MASSADDKKGASGSSDGPTSEEVEEWEKRLMSGNLPEDFLNVTDPKMSTDPGAAATASSGKTSDSVGVSSDSEAMTPMGRDPNQSSHTEPVDHPEQVAHQMTTEEKDHAMAMELQKQMYIEGQEEEAATAAGAFRAGAAASLPYLTQTPPSNAIGRLTVTVVEAKLARNYGIARMDPYCRVRVGHCVYETPTCSNGAREPKWNKTFNCYLLAGVKSMEVEIYDECTFQTDALIAHGAFSIPEDVSQKGYVDDWWLLSGQEGHDKEGRLHLIISMQRLQQPKGATVQAVPGQNVQIPVPQTAPGERQTTPAEQQPPPPQPPQLTEEQLQELCKMFPNLEKEVIVSVYQENRGNQERTVNGLLLISGS